MKTRFFKRLITFCSIAALLSASSFMPLETKAEKRDVRPKTKVTPKISDEQQRRFNAFYLESVIQRENRNIDVSYEMLRHALEIIPDAPEALYDMARLILKYNLEDTTEVAEKLLRRVVELEPDNYYFQKELAEYYDSQNMTDSAIARYEAMSRQFEDRNNLIFDLYDIYKQRSDFPAMLKTLDRLEVKEGKSEDISISKVEIYRMSGQYDEALKEVNKLIKLYPNELSYITTRGNVYYDLKQHQKALEEYRKVLEQNPEEEYTNLSLLAYYKNEHIDSMMIDQAKTMALNPNNSKNTRSTALAQLIYSCKDGIADTAEVISTFKIISLQPNPEAQLLDMYQNFLIMIKKPIDTIVPVWEKLLAIKPDYTQLRLKLLQYYIQKQKFVQSAKLCEDGTQYEPEQVAYYYYGGMSYYSTKDTEKAFDIIHRGTQHISDETSPELVSDLYSFLGDIYYSMEKEEMTYQAYDSALVYNYDNNIVLNNYAYYLSLKRKDLDKAAEMSYRTIKAEPNNATYLDTYAWVLFEQGKIEEAYTYISQALKNISATEENASIFEHAGDILSIKGNTKEALEMWKKAAALKSKSKTLKKKIRRKKYIAP